MTETAKTPAVHTSPTLTKVKPDKRPGAEVACTTCPASMWRVTKSRLTCFCKDARLMSWDGRQDPTLYCDGREAALKRLADEDDS